MGRSIRRLIAVVAAVTATVASGCTGAGEPTRTTVVVSAASSLTDVFEAMEEVFEAEQRHFDLVVNFGGSPTLAVQVQEGAPIDVLAVAGETVAQQVVDAGLADGAPAVFARNGPIIVVPSGNPDGVTGLEDFARDDLLVGLCADGVPCGVLARQVLDEANVTASIDTAEPNARAILGRIAAGEVDAGIGYTTDLAAAPGRVEGIPIDTTATTAYEILTLTAARNRDGADAFVAFVQSDAGQSLLAGFGFLSP